MGKQSWGKKKKVGKQYLLGACPVRSERVFLEMSLLIEEISRYQGMMHRSLYPESTLCKDFSMKTRLCLSDCISTAGTSQVGTFYDLANVSPSILTHESYHFVSRPAV